MHDAHINVDAEFDDDIDADIINNERTYVCTYVRTRARTHAQLNGYHYMGVVQEPFEGKKLEKERR